MDRWERKLAAEVARTHLERECLTDSIVRHYLMRAKEGDIDLLTALTECIKTLVKARIQTHEMLTRQVGIMEMFVTEGDASPASPVPADPFLAQARSADVAGCDGAS